MARPQTPIFVALATLLLIAAAATVEANDGSTYCQRHPTRCHENTNTVTTAATAATATPEPALPTLDATSTPTAAPAEATIAATAVTPTSEVPPAATADPAAAATASSIEPQVTAAAAPASPLEDPATASTAAVTAAAAVPEDAVLAAAAPVAPSAGIKTAAVATCRWIGHCLGDPCRTYNDCDNDWTCVSAKCAVYGSTPTPTPSPSPSPSPAPAPSGTSYRTTLTGYNVMSYDNTSPGALYVGQVSQNFVNNVNIVAVHSKFWSTYGYTQVDITYNGRTGRFVVLDLCADTDCGGCCTANTNYNGNGFLLDVDSAAARRVWGISNAENSLYATATFKPVPNSRVDFAALKRLYP